MKNLLVIICCLFVAHPQLESRPTPPSGNSALIWVVHYSPNDSHSQSWVRENQDGIMGVSYFQHADTTHTSGHLLYRTTAPNGSRQLDTVTAGVSLEKSVLLYDSLAHPHIFVTISDDYDQSIDHYFRNSSGEWQRETILHFYNEGGLWIYEISAAVGPDYSFHLLVLKSRSNVDSDDFWDAWMDSNLYYVTNASGAWEKQLVRSYDMQYTNDFYCKSSARQDIKVDRSGKVHVVYAEQLSGQDDPSRLWYATNASGSWQHEVALNYDAGSRDDAGWFPSLCLDTNDVPHIACDYIDRVYTHSAWSWKLLLLKRTGFGVWSSEAVATHDDGYYGTDGRQFTGGLAHLVFDSTNSPHIVFSDVSCRHESDGQQRVNVGNIRYAKRENGAWVIRTLYRQPVPSVFFNATEMLGLCLNLSARGDTSRIVGIEITTTAPYKYTCRLVDIALPSYCCDSTAGNVDMTGIVDLGDLACLVDFLSPPLGPTLRCLDEANVDGEGIIDLGDLAYLVDYLSPPEGPNLPSCP